MGTRLPSLYQGGQEVKEGKEATAETSTGGAPRPPTPSEVRCACQYYQTDSLLPERTALAALWKHRTMGDHEYEPVAAPKPAPPLVFQSSWDAEDENQTEEAGGQKHEAELERQFLHTPLEDDPGPPPEDGDNEEEAMKEIVGGTPSPPSLSRTPTTESRTDCELTTSQVDSSGIEELPLKRAARSEKGPLGSSLKRRIRNQAGRLRTKMRSIPRPTFKVPEGFTRSKAATTTDGGADSASSAADEPKTEKRRTPAQLFDFRTYPRIFERKWKARSEVGASKRASSSQEGEFAPPPQQPKRKGPLGMRWAQRFSDIRYADEEEAVSGSGNRDNESTSSLRGSAPEGSWSESGGVQGHDEEGRPGVLEEIDADEFFLREKGLSRDDVRRGEEISSEIRDALRPNIDEPQEVELTPPQRPSRRVVDDWKTREETFPDQGFMTFPPQRPKRRKGVIVRREPARSDEEYEEEEEELEDHRIRRRMQQEEDQEQNGWVKDNAMVEGTIMAEQLVSEGMWEEGWGKKETGKKGEAEESGWESEERVRDMEDDEIEVEDIVSGRNEEEEEEEEEEIPMVPPLPPKRRRRHVAPEGSSAVSLDGSQAVSTEEVRMREFDISSTNVSLRQPHSASGNVNGIISTNNMAEIPLGAPDPDYASPSKELFPPVAPRRTRSLTRQPRTLESTISSISAPPRPSRRSKGEFFTVPRPKRPARSGYATPGPPKAPRRRRASTPRPASVPPSEDVACESGDDGERVRDLTAGEVISKMRGRPLPPPPRPPRRAERTTAWEEVVEGHLSLGSDGGPGSMISGKSMSDGEKPPEEVSIAIQTDPLPYDYCVEESSVEQSASTQQLAEREASPTTWPTPPTTPPPVAARRHGASRRQQQTMKEATPPIEPSVPPRPPTPLIPPLPSSEKRVEDITLFVEPPSPSPLSPSGMQEDAPSVLKDATEEEVPSLVSATEEWPSSLPSAAEEQSLPPSSIAECCPPITATTEERPPPLPSATEEHPPPLSSSKEEQPPPLHPKAAPPPEPPRPVPPPRPPKPRREEPAKTEIEKQHQEEQQQQPQQPQQQPSVPPPSFAQLRSPYEISPPPFYAYSIPPPSFFSQDTQSNTTSTPSTTAVALLCVGEISAQRLVVSEFQNNRSPRQPSETEPPRRPSVRPPEWSRRRVARRRPTMKRSHSEGGGKEEGAEDPEDPEVPGIGELSGRLARACGNATVETVRQLLLTAVERVEGEGRTEAAIVIALVMAVALVLLTMGHGRPGHRWEFYLPPTN